MAGLTLLGGIVVVFFTTLGVVTYFAPRSTTKRRKK